MASESKYRKMDKKLHWGTAKEFGKKSPKLKRIAFFTSADRAALKAADRKEAMGHNEIQ